MKLFEIIFQEKENDKWEKGIQIQYDIDEGCLSKSFSLKDNDLLPISSSDIFRLQRL